ncbi:MAG TPA: TolC family protein [Polyangiaceae bacterium]|nr:TolC family protein [Polyangiaceae bacterium]
MGRTRKTLGASLIACTLTGSAWGQARPPTATPGGSGAAAPAPAATDFVPPTLAEPPPLPDIADPMLVPVPPPAHVLSSWRDALVLVHQQSTTLHISEAQVMQAEGASRRALAPALPRINGTATVNRHLLLGTGVNSTGNGFQVNVPIPDPATSFTGSIDLRQSILNLGAWYAHGTALDREKIASLSVKDTERLLLAAAAQAAVSAITAQRVADSSRVSLGSALSTLDLTKRRAALGAASAVDVLRAEQEVSLSRAQVVTADESLRQAREALGTALGDPTQWGVAETVRLEDLEGTANSVCKPVDSVDARSDVVAAQKSVAAAERDRQQVDYLYAPTIDLISTLGYNERAYRNPNNEHLFWTVGAQLLWPLYDGGDRYGQRKTTEAATTIARETLTQKKRDATLQLVQSERSVLVAAANLEVAQHARDIAAESARLSKVAFVNGSGTSFDLVDSARRLREAEIDLLIKEFQVLQARLTAYITRSNCSI